MQSNSSFYCAIIHINACDKATYCLAVHLHTPVDGESDRIVESDTNINCTRFLYKRINTYVNPFILHVFYIVVVCLYFFSTLISYYNYI